LHPVPRVSLSAVVVSYRTGPVLWECLSALLAAADVAEVIVVDNGNTPEDQATLDSKRLFAPKLCVVRGQGNVGFGAGCNLGAAAARGDKLLFVNPDVVLAAHAPRFMASALERTFAPSVVGGDLRDDDGKPERGARRERVTMWSAFVSFSGLSRYERMHPALRDLNRECDPPPPRPAPVHVVSGALMMMRRADFEALGGFDEGYFLHVDDIDMCRRVEEAGGQVMFAPGAFGVHQRSSSDAPKVEVERHKARGFARYFRKFARTPGAWVCALFVGAALGVILPMRARR
jgi:N-acetylglucosaminyl-diphospho-decaprenol L-rhamnosyltransferase